MKKRLLAFLLVLIVVVPCAASAGGWYRLVTKERLWNLPDYDSKVMDTYRTDWALTVNGSVDKTWVGITYSNGISGYVEKKSIVLDKSSNGWICINTAHLKHGPGSSFRNEGTLHLGDYVTVLTHGNNWSYVSSSAGYGYVSNGALSQTKVTAASSGSAYKSTHYTAWIVSRGDPVGLRSAPSGSNYVVMETFYPGTQVTVLQQGPDFCYVRIASGGEEGYMRTRYLSTNKPAQAYQLEEKQGASSSSSGSSAPASGPSGFPFAASARANNGEKPRLYKGEGLGWSSDVLAVGTPITVVAPGNDIYWVKVEVNGRTGYMPIKFIIR